MVRFDEPSHTYTTESGLQYTSVTTVIGEYKEPFDKEFWSIYKAVERVYIDANSSDEWIKHKKEYKPKGIVNNFKTMSYSNDFLNKVDITIKNVIDEWDYERDISCYNGTNFHKQKENELFTLGVSGGLKVNTPEEHRGIPVELESLPDGIYPELTLWSNYYKLAGQADVVTIYTIDGIRYIDIDDHKTNKEIKSTSFFNAKTKRHSMMKSPISHIQDCNKEHYKLQLSTYAYMLECAGFIPKKLTFNHYKNVGTKKEPSYIHNKEYLFDYDKKSVVRMLNHFKISKK
jgi:hypothetical protein